LGLKRKAFIVSEMEINTGSGDTVTNIGYR